MNHALYVYNADSQIIYSRYFETQQEKTDVIKWLYSETLDTRKEYNAAMSIKERKRLKNKLAHEERMLLKRRI